MLRIFIIVCLYLFTATSVLADKIKIGAILPLSGTTADYGIAMVNSIKLAMEDHPEISSNVEFIYEDAAYDPTKAVTAFNKLVDSDKVDLVYTWGVSFCKAVSPIAERRKVPMVGQCIDPESSKDKKYVIRFMNSSDQFLALQANYLKERGFKRIGIVITEIAYLEEMLTALKRHLYPGQTVEVIQSYIPESRELRDSVLKLRRGNYDTVGVFLFGGQISTYTKLLTEQKNTIPVFGSNLFESLSEVNAARGTMDGTVFVSNAVKPEFFKRYVERFGNSSQLSFGGPTYEFAITMGKIASEKSEKSLLDRLSAITEPQNGYAAGPYHFVRTAEAGGSFDFPLSVKAVCKDSFVELKPDEWKTFKCP